MKFVVMHAHVYRTPHLHVHVYNGEKLLKCSNCISPGKYVALLP